MTEHFLSTFSQLITDDDDNASSWRTSNFLKFEFYQQFFDVDTTAVKDRVLYSMVPLPGKSFLQHHIRPKPDLYGPFWVCVTLVFSIAISGNMATYLQKSFEADEDHPVNWHYDFHKVTFSQPSLNLVLFSTRKVITLKTLKGIFIMSRLFGAPDNSSSKVLSVKL